jgi:hypothetical protein
MSVAPLLIQYTSTFSSSSIIAAMISSTFTLTQQCSDWLHPIFKINHLCATQAPFYVVTHQIYWRKRDCVVITTQALDRAATEDSDNFVSKY